MGIFDKKHGGEKVDEAADLPAYERDHSLDVQDGLFENAVRTQLLKLTETTELSSPDVNTSDTPTALLFCTMTYIVAQANPRLGQVSIGSGLAHGGFIRMAGHWVDDALGFMAGWNFFFYEALLIPFEVTALNSVLGFGECKALRPVWRDDIPTWAVCIACIILYAAINILAVRAYGEAEFWLSGGKVILIFLLFAFTFITMVGGNPRHDAYGFRYWKNPGAFAEHITTGSLGKFEGFLAALWSASFTVVGPEYISMVAAEAKRPRIYIKNAFKTVYWRFGIFFIGGALAVGIVIPYNDKTLVGILAGTSTGAGTAAASPYVIAMQNLGIGVLPNIVNALMVTSIFSAGNTYTYCATRSLYGLALEGRAPKFLRYCTNGGVPLYCFLIVMIFPFLSFLSVSSSSNVVLTWLVDLITAGGIID
ncbi:hypothetical protein LTR91_019486 [Friedmanniomyces endolithicus]|uniref:Amino acid permease/ SLC12A domain-containing protein n=1 Tax=Friedmanniomyces endolithicus TaxID=329885 RepID=A0AAN6H9J1_9PEZI|nr:hypothetical protein LTR94_012203 [Friedmanniomyces endolithicus]KAK0773616.1 hypothetical protein LTR59_015214 [Friedmanniomyces endolithicus]KAK0779859.1 hypothetical protein LTR38_014279 [Friedmanniomyces endolithicus]KAK0820085.1 hypothetical protein LTR75_001855 [Friedmanniomyces endolithicus]KAK0858014.1 hypothetical protein LTS02_010007 [Friedmanniomyces endolithicus]